MARNFGGWGIGARRRTAARGMPGPSGIVVTGSSTEVAPGSGITASSTTAPIISVSSCRKRARRMVRLRSGGRQGLVAPPAHAVVAAVVGPVVGDRAGAVADLDLEAGRRGHVEAEHLIVVVP